MSIRLAVLTVTLLAGCASVPEPLRGEFPALTPQGSVNQGINNQRVRWGGEIVDTLPGREETCFEVLSQALNDQGRPVENTNSQGRFIACARGFYDPAVYTEGRDLTVVGTLDTTVTRKIGEYDYRYPQISVQQIYLWPQESAYARGPYYGSPYYGYPYPGGLSLGFFNNYYPGYYGGPFYRHRPPIINRPRPPAQNSPTPTMPDVPTLRDRLRVKKPAPNLSAPPSLNFQRSTPAKGMGGANRF